MKLINVSGEIYRACDTKGEEIIADDGEVFEVSEARAEAILKDFPGKFRVPSAEDVADPFAAPPAEEKTPAKADKPGPSQKKPAEPEHTKGQ